MLILNKNPAGIFGLKTRVPRRHKIVWKYSPLIKIGHTSLFIYWTVDFPFVTAMAPSQIMKSKGAFICYDLLVGKRILIGNYNKTSWKELIGNVITAMNLNCLSFFTFTGNPNKFISSNNFNQISRVIC